VRACDLNDGLYMINHGEVDILGVVARRAVRGKRLTIYSTNEAGDSTVPTCASRVVAIDKLSDGDFFGDVEVH